MGVYNDLLYPYPFGDGEEKKADSKIINEILKQIKELQAKIAELEKAMSSIEKDTSRAKQEAEQALATAQLALSNMQAMLAQIEAINNKATQADNKATQALNSINDIRTEISIIARVADNAINTATEAIDRANEAKINIGNLENLTTQDKTNIVAAINEINQKSASMPELELNTEVQIATFKENGNTYKVMQKIVDLGPLPNSTSKTVPHGIDKTKVLRYLAIQGSASQENFGNTLPLPCVTLGSESVSNNIYVAVGANNITISTGRDRTAYTGTLTITYVDNAPIT